jgi:hypothetical protein
MTFERESSQSVCMSSQAFVLRHPSDHHAGSVGTAFDVPLLHGISHRMKLRGGVFMRRMLPSSSALADIARLHNHAAAVLHRLLGDSDMLTFKRYVSYCLIRCLSAIQHLFHRPALCCGLRRRTPLASCFGRACSVPIEDARPLAAGVWKSIAEAYGIAYIRMLSSSFDRDEVSGRSSFRRLRVVATAPVEVAQPAYRRDGTNGL